MLDPKFTTKRSVEIVDGLRFSYAE